MSTNYGFEPTLDGLNNIDADNTTTSDIVCNTIVINTSGTAPTMPPANNSTHIATTAYVDAATTGVFVTLGTTQTITGQKTFSNANTYINGLLQMNDAIVLNSGSMYSPLGTSMVISAAGLTDDLTLIGGNSIALIGTTNITGTTTITGAEVVTGQASAGSIMTNNYNPFLATADVNINPTQTSGSLNLGTKIDRSGIIQIGNGVNATCDIRIGTARTTGGTVSMGSNSSIANTLNLQSALINVGTGSPIGTANTINIGNGNTGSLIDLKNDTTITGTANINVTGTKATSIGNTTGALTLTGSNINLTPASTGDVIITNKNQLLSTPLATTGATVSPTFPLESLYMITSTTASNRNYILPTATSVNAGAIFRLVNTVPSNTVDYTITISTTGTQYLTLGNGDATLNLQSYQLQMDETSVEFIYNGTDYWVCMSPRPVIPTGTIISYPIAMNLTTFGLQNRYVLCDGSSLNATTNPKYFNLWKVIGTTFGGTGVTAFSLPNLQGTVLKGAGTKTVTQTNNSNAGGTQSVAHTATISAFQDDATLVIKNTGYWSAGSGGGAQSRARTRIPADGEESNPGNDTSCYVDRYATEVRVYNMGVNWYIKL